VLKKHEEDEPVQGLEWGRREESPSVIGIENEVKSLWKHSIEVGGDDAEEVAVAQHSGIVQHRQAGLPCPDCWPESQREGDREDEEVMIFTETDRRTDLEAEVFGNWGSWRSQLSPPGVCWCRPGQVR
jgi:hypothetical protein